MASKNKEIPDYDFVCFEVLAYEFQDGDKRECEKKIRKRLSYYKLGPFDTARVETVRALKNDLMTEFSNPRESNFYNDSHSEFADMADFNLESMRTVFAAKFPQIAIGTIASALNFAVYLYYLR